MPNSGGTFNARRPTVVTRCHRCGRRRSSPTSCSPIAPVAPVTTARSDAALAIAAVDPAPAPPAPALATLVSAVDCAGASLPSCDDIARLQALQLGACAMRSSCNGKCAEIYMGKYKSLSFVSKMHISPSSYIFSTQSTTSPRESPQKPATSPKQPHAPPNTSPTHDTEPPAQAAMPPKQSPMVSQAPEHPPDRPLQSQERFPQKSP